MSENGEPVVLSVAEAVAITLAYCGQADDDSGDWVPGLVWESLHDRGLLKTVRDITGDGITTATDAGQFALALAIRAAFDDQRGDS